MTRRPVSKSERSAGPARRGGGSSPQAAPRSTADGRGGAVVEQLLAAAVARHRQGRTGEAAAAYAEVLAVEPNQPDALHLMGVLAHQRGDHESACAWIGRAIAADRKVAAYHNSLGAALLSLGRSDAAATAFRRAIGLNRAYAEAHSNLGNALMAMGEAREAETCYRRAVAARPDYAAGYNNLGGALRKQGKLEAAATAYGDALARQPSYAGALCNLGRVLHDQGRFAEALAHYDRALALDPNHAEAHANRAVVLLLLGRLPEGWAEYEWRWRVAGFSGRRRDLGRPLWDGTVLGGRRILIHAEQGLGSAIQFVRYAAVAAERGGEIILECDRPLARLFSCLVRGPSAPVSGLVVKGDHLPAFDVQAPLMSLPGIVGTELTTIPNRVPYLSIDRGLSEEWEGRLAALPRPRVGLVWAGNPEHDNDVNRSMAAKHLAPLLAMAGVAYTNLQVGAARTDLRRIGAARAFDPTPEIADFADTAAIIGHLDLVISVDTAVGHLAGALAKPVWLLVPFVPEWRWMGDREDSPWYPTMRLFRQERPGDWPGVIARVGTALAALTGRAP